MSKTWIVVADGAKAHILLSEGAGKKLQELETMGSIESTLQSHEIGSDRPGRTFSSVGSNRSAKEPPTDPQRYAKIEFAHQVARRLEEKENEFDQLVLIASPKTLGDLRGLLSTKLQNKIIGELAKDLTYLPAQDLPRHLDGIIRVQG